MYSVFFFKYTLYPIEKIQRMQFTVVAYRTHLAFLNLDGCLYISFLLKTNIHVKATNFIHITF